MTTAVIYTNGSQECERMVSLLKKLPSVTNVHNYELGNDFTKQQFQMEFGCDATYPQIAIGVNHIGNMNESLKYMSRSGMFK